MQSLTMSRSQQRECISDFYVGKNFLQKRKYKPKEKI